MAKANLFEHREMVRYGAASTQCPSNRIPWQRLIADLEDDDMALTFEQRVAAHEQWHRETLDPWMRNRSDRIIQLEGEVTGLKGRVAKLEARPTGGGLKRGDSVKLT